MRQVRWTGQHAVVTLPRHIDSSNADEVREQLLRAVNSGPAVLIADLAATVSCDYSGAEAIARSYQRAVASGIVLRLVVAAQVVRRALRVNGLHRLIPMYSTLDAALAATRDASEPPAVPGTAVTTAVVPRHRPPARRPDADLDDGTGALLDRAVNHILTAAMNLQDAHDLPRDAIARRITDSVGRLNAAVREIRDYARADQSPASQPDPATRRLQDMYERKTAAVENTAFLRQRLVDSAHTLHAAAVDTAVLLEQRADLVGEPGAIDYPTDIKRWKIVADQAEELAKRWEQSPSPHS